MLTDIVGYMAMVVGVSFMAPQIYRSWRTKRVTDLSWAMLALYFANCVLWGLYAALIVSVPLLLTNLLAACLAGTQLLLKLIYGVDEDYEREEWDG